MYTLVVSDISDGGFLQPYPYITHSYNRFDGILQVSGTLTGVQPGVSGSGTLIIIEFLVTEGGDSELHLFETVLLDSNLQPISHNTFDGYYEGPKVDLVNKQLTRRDMYVCETIEFKSTVKNLADVPLYTRVRFDMIRDDGAMFRFYAGQTAGKSYPGTKEQYLYVNSFDWGLDQWVEEGTDPYLDAPGDGSYIWDTVNGHINGGLASTTSRWERAYQLWR
jgi:hypothetical protein